jgi:hypothetical protein
MGRPAASPLDRSVDVFVNHLRQKIEADARSPLLIKTVRSVGYVLDLPKDMVRRYAAGRVAGPGPAPGPGEECMAERAIDRVRA